MARKCNVWAPFKFPICFYWMPSFGPKIRLEIPGLNRTSCNLEIYLIYSIRVTINLFGLNQVSNWSLQCMPCLNVHTPCTHPSIQDSWIRDTCHCWPWMDNVCLVGLVDLTLQSAGYFDKLALARRFLVRKLGKQQPRMLQADAADCVILFHSPTAENRLAIHQRDIVHFQVCHAPLEDVGKGFDL